MEASNTPPPNPIEAALTGFRRANLRCARFALQSTLCSTALERDPAYSAMLRTADQHGEALDAARKQESINRPTLEFNKVI
jgi:hypothetical protein